MTPRVTRALDMSASGLSLFANFRPFFVSHYEGSEELCREIQARYHYYCKPNQCKVTAADCCACLASRSQRHGGTMIGPKDAGFENAILLKEDGIVLEERDVITK